MFAYDAREGFILGLAMLFSLVAFLLYFVGVISMEMLGAFTCGQAVIIIPALWIVAQDEDDDNAS